MDKVITVYDAKTNLSKLIKRAKAGETIYLGAYGQPEAKLTAATEAQPRPIRNIGIWDGKYKIDYDALGAMDAEIADEMINGPLSS